MAKSLYDEVIGDAEVDIDCPECERSFKIRMKQIGTTVSCPHCNVAISLKEEGTGFSEAEAAMDEFEKSLDNL